MSDSEFLRRLVGWEFDPENVYSVDALLRLQEVEARELARREGVRGG
jgi:hypothetical protein